MSNTKEVIKNVPEISGLVVLQHEIEQHLHNIHNMNQLLAMSAREEKIQNITDQIRLHSFSALQKIGDFADYIANPALYDSYNRVKLQKVDIVTITRKIHDRLLALVTAECDVNISFKSGIHSISVATDVRRFEKILCNFASNASRSAPYSGAQRIKWDIDGDEDGVTISIKNLSGGLSVEDERIISEIFKSDDYLAVSPTSGFGLGLAVSLKHATEIGAKLSAENTPGVWVEFSITVPRNLEATDGELILSNSSDEDDSKVFFAPFGVEKSRGVDSDV